MDYWLAGCSQRAGSDIIVPSFLPLECVVFTFFILSYTPEAVFLMRGDDTFEAVSEASEP
jgi:hypothetical protein